MEENVYKIALPIFSALLGGFAIKNTLNGNVDAAVIAAEAATSIASGLISINGSIYDSKK